MCTFVLSGISFRLCSPPFQAKADYEEEQRRKELKRLRGEDTWMLNDVNARVEELEKVVFIA